MRTVELPALARLRIPPDALLVRADLPQLAQLRTGVNARGADGTGPVFRAETNWREGDADVRAWLAAAGTPSPDRLMRLDLEELGALLFHYARSQPTPLRLAIVFSGGGAKCSYQIGAIRAIEEKLAQLRQETGDGSIDVSLVVGTSGGAINALPVAMGMSSTTPLCDELAAVWRSLDQREIIRPAFVVRLNMALWFASLQFLFFSWICRHRMTDQGRTGLGRWLLCLGAGVARGALRPSAVRSLERSWPPAHAPSALSLADLRRGGGGLDPGRNGPRGTRASGPPAPRAGPCWFASAGWCERPRSGASSCSRCSRPGPSWATSRRSPRVPASSEPFWIASPGSLPRRAGPRDGPRRLFPDPTTALRRAKPSRY